MPVIPGGRWRGTRRFLAPLVLVAGVVLPCAAQEDPRDDEHAYIFRYRVRPSDLYSSFGPLPHSDTPNHGDHARLSVEDHARLQADALAYWKTFRESGRPVTREVMIELYRKARDFSVVHALLGSETIAHADSVRLGELRAALHLEVVDNLVRSGRFGDRLGINDFGTIGTALSDIDFTLFTEKGIPGDQLVAAYVAEFKRVTGGVDPGQMDVVAHRWEATVPDWRQSQLSLAEYAGRLRKGTELLKLNPEAYFLEGAYAQQIMGRSATGETFTWFQKERGGSVRRNSVNAAESTAFFYRPELLARYAWGGSVGNWHFYHSHGHDKVGQAKYLLRSFDDGAGRTLPPSLKDAKFEDLSPAKQRAAVQALYRNRGQVEIDAIVAMLRTAVSIRRQKDSGGSTDGPEAFRPMIDHERFLDPGADAATLLERARRSVDRHGQAMLIENNRISAGTRLRDWLSPPIEPGKYRTVGADGRMRTIEIDAEAVTRLQYNSFFELKDGIAVLPEAEVEAIKRQNPRARGDIEILERLIRKQREMAVAPDDLAGPDATKYRQSAARDVLDDLARLDQVAAEGGPVKFAGEAVRLGWHNAQRFETWIQQTMVNALRPVFGGADSKYLPQLDHLLETKAIVDERLNNRFGPLWMVRLDKANSVLEVLKERARQGEWNWEVASVAFREGMSFMPGVGTLYQFQSGAQGVITLVSTQIIPGYGQMMLAMNVVRGSVELVGLAVITPLQGERLDLAYYGYLEAGAGGFIESGQKTRVESRLPSILLPIDDDASKPMDERRKSVYRYFHDDITRTIDADPAFDFTEAEWPLEWAEQERRWLEVRIRQHVNHWWNATGPFASYDELVVHRTATMDEKAFREELEQRLWRDYWEGKKIALHGKVEEKNSAVASLTALFEQISAVMNGLTQRALEMSDEFLRAGEMLWAYALDQMPVIEPAIEITLAPRVVRLELDDTYVEDDVLAIPALGAAAKVYASEAEHPLPWSVRWELEAGGVSRSLGAGESVEIEGRMESATGDQPLHLTAIAFDAGGGEIIRHRVPLAIEKVELDLVRRPSPGDDRATGKAAAGSGEADGRGTEVPPGEQAATAGFGKADGTGTGTTDACTAAVEAFTAGRSVVDALGVDLGDAEQGGLGGTEALERRRQAIARVDSLAERVSRLATQVAEARDRSADLRDRICEAARRFPSIEPGAGRETVRREALADLGELEMLRGRAERWRVLVAGVLAEGEELSRALAGGAPDDGRGLERRLAELEERLSTARAAIDALPAAPAAGCELPGGGPALASDLDALGARLKALREAAARAAAENAALRARAEAAAAALADATVTAELLETFIGSILNRAADAARCAGLLDVDPASDRPEPPATVPAPGSSDGGWRTGERADEQGGGWSSGVRVDETDPCRGPRPEFEAALQRVASALRARDFAALAPAIGGVRPECPGDAELMTSLRDQAVALARAEADGNAARMRSAVSGANARARRNAQAWASALGTIQDAINGIGRSGPATPGVPAYTGAGATSTTTGPPSGGAGENRCLVDSHTQITPERKGEAWEYYVQETRFGAAGTLAFKILQFSRSSSGRRTIPGSVLHGPYGSLAAAKASQDRLCPVTRRATDSMTFR